MAKLISIAAIGENNELGLHNKLIWHLKKDMIFFKNSTMGKKIVMGYNTFLSMPSELPGRQYVILTHKTLDIPNALVFHDFDELCAYLNTLDEDIYIVGGSSIYKLFQDIVDEILLTEIHATSEADAYYPTFNKNDFTRQTIESIEDNPPYEFVKYIRKK